MEWRTRNVTLFSAGEYLALSDKSNVVSGPRGTARRVLTLAPPMSLVGT